MKMKLLIIIAIISLVSCSSDDDEASDILISVTNSQNWDGINIIAGTKDKPIVTDSDKIPIKHLFMDGVYIREMSMLEGTAVIGAIHKQLHMCFLLTGCLTVTDENGTEDYIAPCYVVSTPGVKRVILANEDSIFELKKPLLI